MQECMLLVLYLLQNIQTKEPQMNVFYTHTPYTHIAEKFPKRRKIDFPFKEESGQIISCLCEIAAEITG